MNEITIKKVKDFFDVGLMKLHQKLLLLMVLFSTISLNAQTTFTTPWYEGFTSGTDPFANGWTNGPGTFSLGTHSTLQGSNPTPSQGIYLYKNLWGSTNTGSFTSPNIGPIQTDDKLTFTYKHINWGSTTDAPGEDSGYFKLFVSSNGGEFTVIAEIENSTEADWINYEFDLSDYLGETIQFKIVTTLEEGDHDYVIGFDNFFISNGACDLPGQPTQTTTELTEANITVAGLETDNYQIEYGPFGFTLGNGTTTEVSENNVIHITGLNHSSSYSYYLRKVCADDAKSPWVGPFTLLTACDTVTGNINENFNSTPAGTTTNPSPPLCWSYLGPEFIDYNSAYGYTSTYSSSPLNRVFYFSNNMDIESSLILVSPQTENLGNGTKRLRFDAWSSSWSPSIVIVGTMSDPTNPSTFTPIPSGSFETTGTASEYIINIPTGTNDYFAFKFDNSDYYKYLYLDNINYEDTPICPDIEFGSVVATNILAHEATLTWVSTSTNFDIKYGPLNFNFETEGTLIEGVQNNYNLTDLTPATGYTFYVRSNCGTDGLGSWRGPINFTTQTILPAPWFEGFTTGTAPGWNNIAGNIFTLTNTATSLQPLQNYALAANIYNANHVGAGVTSPNIGPILANQTLSFDYRLVNYSSQTPVDPAAGNVDMFISTDFGQNYTYLTSFEYGESSDWQSFTMNLDPAYIGQLVKIKFAVNYNYEPWPADNYDHWVAFDNFYIGNCSLPATPQVVTTTMNTATLSIEGEANANYEIEYGPLGFTQGQGEMLNVTGNSIEITELEAATVYEYYIKSICTDSNSPQIGRFRFITACDVFDAINETFGSTTDLVTVSSSYNYPLCWSLIAEGTGNAYRDSWSSNYYMYDSSSADQSLILISPETDNLGNGLYRVRFKASTSEWSPGTIIFGTMTNPNDATTFEPLQVIQPGANPAEYYIYLPETNADYFAFKPGTKYASVYLDDIIYEPTPACPAPVSLNASVNFEDLSATLTWNGPPTSTNNNFSIEWGPAGFTQGEGTIVTSTTYSTVISNLTLEESYSFYVKRICTDEETNWVGPYIFEVDYCESDFNTYDGDGVTGITITGQELPIELDVTYQFIENAGITFNAVDEQNIAVTFETGFNTSFKVYIDLNNNGFDSGDLYAHGYNEDGEGTTTQTISLPNNGAFSSGNYRVRIITEYSDSISGPCEQGSWGQTYDFYADFIFPCIQPTGINFEDVGYDYAIIDWEGQGNSNYEIEYGPTGFTQGEGTTILNVTKPYTLENLTPGTTYDFYIRKNCLNVNSDWSTVATTYVFCNTATPTGASSQTLIQDELLSDLEINGQNLKYYLDYNRTQQVPASTAVQTSATYFITQTINCESDDALIVNLVVIPRIAKPTVAPNQNFCNGGTIADIEVTSLPGATVIWYQTSTSTEALPPNTLLSTGTYYVVQTDGITTSHRVSVPVTMNPTPANLVPQPVHLCGEYTFGTITINNLTGTTVRWYATPDATTPIDNNTPVTTGTYYVTQSFGICESQKVPYQVSQFATLNKPTAGTQTFCGTGTVGELVAEGLQGAEMVWYASANSVIPLTANTALTTGTYYVAQTINGCYSEKRAVAVRVVSISAPQVNPFILCGSGTVADLVIPTATGVTYKWYNSPNSTTELTQNTALTTGMYFVERVHYGCVSARTAVQVTIGDVPNAPTTTATTQSLVEGSTLANLIVNQTNVTWYSTYNDSQSGTNPLALNLPLENGKTYYAVIIGTNGCPSLPLAITVDVYLSNDEFVKSDLKYYPNPVVDILNISYTERIIQIEIFDLLGKRVKSINANDNNIELNLSDLSSGTYMVQLRSETKQQFIKIVKK